MKINKFIKGALFVLASALIIGFSIGYIDAPLGQAAGIVLGGVILLLPIMLQNPELGLALVGFFLPFERIPTVELGGLNVKINYILIIVVLFSYLLAKAITKDLKIPKDPIRYFLIIFAFSFLLSYTQAINKQRAVEVIISFALMMIVYLTVTLVAQSRKAIEYVVKGVIWGAIVAGAVGIFQFLGDMAGLPTQITLLKPGYDKSTMGFARVMAFSQEPLYFANYIFIPVLITFILLLRGQVEKIIGRFPAVILLLILLLDFVLAISRGAYLAAAVVFVLILISQASLIFRIKTILVSVSLMLAVVCGSYLYLVKSESDALDNFVEHTLVRDVQGESVVSRLDANEQAYDLFISSPVLGVGPGNFGPLVQGDPIDKPESGWFIVNNEYMEILSENGLVGIITFFILLIVIFWRSVLAFCKAQDQFLKSLILALIFALFAILVQYAFFSTIYIFHIWFLIGLIAALSNLILNKDAQKNI